MISKHIDLIALGVLLLAIAAFNGARQVVVMTWAEPARYIRLDHSRTMIVVRPEPRAPEAPPAPPVLQRD